jgi:hypothetical protein
VADYYSSMNARRRWTWLAFSISLAGLPCLARAEWLIDSEVRWRYEDNVGDAASNADAVGDSITAATLSASRFFPAASGYSMNVGAQLDGERYDRLHGLSNASVGGVMSLRKKWGLGAYAPWALLNGSIGRTNYQDSYRNASVYRAGMSAGRRLNERWNVSIDWTYEQRKVASVPEEEPGVSADAFSQASHTFDLNAQFAATATVFFNATIIYRHGEMTSTVLDEDTVIAGARAQADDHAFGPEAYAYRLLANTWGFRASLGYAPTPHHSFSVGLTRYDAHADGGAAYTKSTPAILWDYRF